MTSDELLDVVGAIDREAAVRPMYAGLLPGRRTDVQGAVLHVHLRGETGLVDQTFVVSRSKRSKLAPVERKEVVRRCMTWLKLREREAVVVSPSLAIPSREAA